MKKLKFLLVALVAVLVFPLNVFAEETNKEVNIYFFNGNGCPHCEDAETWFDEIEEEYGDKFKVVSYEVWYNEQNNELMNAVAEARGETADGVPYIVIGNQSWSGFDDSYKDAMLDKIESEYAQAVEERYDVMDYVDLTGSKTENGSSTGRDVLILILILAIGGAIVGGTIYARKNTQ